MVPGETDGSWPSRTQWLSELLVEPRCRNVLLALLGGMCQFQPEGPKLIHPSSPQLCLSGTQERGQVPGHGCQEALLEESSGSQGRAGHLAPSSRGCSFLRVAVVPLPTFPSCSLLPSLDWVWGCLLLLPSAWTHPPVPPACQVLPHSPGRVQASPWAVPLP